MGVKIKVETKHKGKPTKIELPYKLGYKIYDLTEEEWKKLEEKLKGLKEFLTKLYEKQEAKLKKEYKEKIKKKIEEKLQKKSKKTDAKKA